MRIGLFVPCYVDAFHPEVGIATLELLERLGCDVEYPFDQTCCGQPMTNTGCHQESAATEALFVRNFAPYDYVVSPSGSCVHQVRFAFDAIEQTDQVRQVRAKAFELVEFIHDVLKVDAFPWAEFPHKVALHNKFVELARPDECCGFGGTFSVFEEGVSAKMGHDKVKDQHQSGAEYVTSSDGSCMLHQQGCAERLGLPQKYIHIAQILNGARA